MSERKKRKRKKSDRCTHVGPAGKSWAQAWSPRLGFVYGDDERFATEKHCLYCGEVVP